MPRLRITPELFQPLLNSDDPIDALHQFASWWSARPGRTEQQPNFGLSPTEYDVHLYLNYLADVGNGGHCQFFLNPAGRHAAATCEALGRLGLSEIQLILQEACSAFAGAKPPGDDEAREALINQFPESVLSRWYQLDKQLYAVDRASWSRVLAYVRSHEDDVLVAERT
jgi:hypothetical protein